MPSFLVFFLLFFSSFFSFSFPLFFVVWFLLFVFPNKLQATVNGKINSDNGRGEEGVELDLIT